MADTNLDIGIGVDPTDAVSGGKKVESAFGGINSAVKKAARGTDQLRASSKGLNRGIGGLGRSAGQASIQVQQLVGQIQGGVNPAVALSQQAADLGFVLGVPLLGAITAVAAGFAGPFITSLFGASEALDELIGKAQDAEVNLQKIAPTIFAEKQGELKEALAAATAEVEKQEERVNGINAAFDAQIAKLEETAVGELNRRKRLRDIAKLEERRPDAIREANIALEEARIAQAAAQKQLDDFADSTKGATDENEKLNDSLDTQSSFMRNINKIRFQAIVDARDAQIKADQEAAKAKEQSDKKALAFMKKINRQRFDAIVAARDAEIQKEKEAAEIIARNQAAAHKSALEKMREEQKRFENVIEGGLNTMADGFVGVIRGTNSLASAFNNMANQIINDLLRMAMQKLIVDRIMGAVFGGASSIGTASGFTSVGPAAGAGGASGGQAILPGLADGGTARAGRAHIVGERGPELLVPGRTSQVVPNHALGGVNVTQNINISTGVQQTVRAEIAGLMPQIAEASKNAVIDARRRGGSFAGAFGA